MGAVLQKPRRLPDWRPRLAEYLNRIAAARFRPGRHDCALFAAGAVQAMTGADLAAPWRGKYRTLEDGLEALRAAGFASHVEFTAAHFDEVPPAFAQVGDLGVFDTPEDGGNGALGVVQGAHVYVLHPTGLALVDRFQMKKAFRV